MHIYDLKRNFVNNSSKEDNEPPLPFRERGKKKIGASFDIYR